MVPMGEKVQINYDEVIRTLEFWALVNRADLKEIEWVRDNGDTITYDNKLADSWKFVGLSNVYFAQIILSEVLAGNQEKVIKELVYDN
jgi:hypothetical protein